MAEVHSVCVELRPCTRQSASRPQNRRCVSLCDASNLRQSFPSTPLSLDLHKTHRNAFFSVTTPHKTLLPHMCRQYRQTFYVLRSRNEPCRVSHRVQQKSSPSVPFTKTKRKISTFLAGVFLSRKRDACGDFSQCKLCKCWRARRGPGTLLIAFLCQAVSLS